MDKQSVRVNKETIKFVNKTYEKLSILKCSREGLRYFNYDSDDEVIDENIDKVYELLDEIYFKSIEKKSSNIVKKDELKPRKLVFDDDHEEIVEPMTPSTPKNILEHVLEYSSSSDDDDDDDDDDSEEEYEQINLVH